MFNVHREESKEQIVDLVNYQFQVHGTMQVVEFVDIDGKHLSGIFLIDEFFVEVVQSLEVFDLDGLLVLASSLLDVLNQVRDVGSKVNHQVGHMELRLHLFEKFHKSFVVAVAQLPHSFVIGHEDVYTLIDAAVLYNCALAFVDDINLQSLKRSFRK